jgi:hypothetical protein
VVVEKRIRENEAAAVLVFTMILEPRDISVGAIVILGLTLFDPSALNRYGGL